MKWKATFGDEPVTELDVPSSTPIAYFGARSGLPVTEFGVVGFDLSTQYLLDGRANMVRRLPGGPISVPFRAGGVEFFIGNWSGAGEVAVNAETGQIIEPRDPRLSNLQSIFTTDNRLQLGSVGSSLWLGVF